MVAISNASPVGPAETFFAVLRQALYGRVEDATSPYDLQAHFHPAPAELVAVAEPLRAALAELGGPSQAGGTAEIDPR